MWCHEKVFSDGDKLLADGVLRTHFLVELFHSDGAQKHFTKIGKDSFVGSDTQMIAPVEIGDRCFVASGSTIGQSMPSGSFAIARSRQITKEGMAKKFIKNKEEL